MNFEFMTIDTPLPPCMAFPRALTGFPVSSTAKVMYCRMLDAMLSNGQEDENGILFVCFPVTAIAAVLSRSSMTVSYTHLEFLSMLMDMETTSQQSINDAPVNKDSITININGDGASGTTLVYYVDKGCLLYTSTRLLSLPCSRGTPTEPPNRPKPYPNTQMCIRDRSIIKFNFAFIPMPSLPSLPSLPLAPTALPTLIFVPCHT